MHVCEWEALLCVHLAPLGASGSLRPVDIHLGAQIGLVCTLCVHAWVCMHTHVPHCARTPRKPHQDKRHRARAAGGWQIQRARRREGGWDEKRVRSLLGITLTGPNPDPVETFETQNVPHRGRARTHRCAHAHTGGPTLTAEGGPAWSLRDSWPAPRTSVASL